MCVNVHRDKLDALPLITEATEREITTQAGQAWLRWERQSQP